MLVCISVLSVKCVPLVPVTSVSSVEEQLSYQAVTAVYRFCPRLHWQSHFETVICTFLLGPEPYSKKDKRYCH